MSFGISDKLKKLFGASEQMNEALPYYPPEVQQEQADLHVVPKRESGGSMLRSRLQEQGRIDNSGKVIPLDEAQRRQAGAARETKRNDNDSLWNDNLSAMANRGLDQMAANRDYVGYPSSGEEPEPSKTQHRKNPNRLYPLKGPYGGSNNQG